MSNEQQLQQALATFVETMNSATAFAGDQLPIIVQQALTFYTIVSVLWLVFAVAWSVAAVYAIKYLLKKRESLEKFSVNGMDRTDASFLIGIISVATVLIVPLLFFSNVAELIKITLTPELWVIEYASTLIR